MYICEKSKQCGLDICMYVRGGIICLYGYVVQYVLLYVLRARCYVVYRVVTTYVPSVRGGSRG